MVYPIVKYVFYPLLRIFVKEIKGLNNLPKKKHFILAANHTSYIDAPLMFFLIVWHLNKKIHFYLIKKMLNNFFWRIILEKWFGALRINGSVENAMQHVKKGCLVGIFPEGGRTRTGKLQKVTHTGLGITTLLSKYQVVPIGLIGTYKFWNPHMLFPNPLKRITINIGKPMTFRKKPSVKNARLVNKQVMKQIAKLIGQKYPY